MNDITIVKRFFANGNFNREKENFTYTLFENIDFTNDSEPTSFFRCDFRGAKFIDVHFFKNNFDRADFISCVFINTNFLNVNIATSEIKNCFFDNVIFTKNLYDFTSIQECTFINCTFENEDILTNMKNCNFIKCKIKNCRFERSTTEKISFESCDISSTDFANMHAERYNFKSCSMTDVNIDICYIFGYLFYNTNIYGINIIYMGERVEFTEDNLLNNYASALWKQGRYYEFMNANIMFQNYDFLPKLIEKAFSEIDTSDNYLRKLEICNIFDLLQFYFTCNVFNFKIVNAILSFLDEFTWDIFDFDERIIYLSLFQKLKMYISEYKYDDMFINSAQNDFSIITFYCNTEDYNLAFKTVEKFLLEICAIIGVSGGFEFIEAKKGSWILIFLTVTSCALLLPKILKKYVDIYIEVDTKKRISKKLKDKLNKKNISITEIKMIADIASDSGILKKNEDNVDLSDISKIMETIKINL